MNEKKNARDQYLNFYEELYLEYSRIDDTQVMTKEKKAFWIQGKPEINKALFLAHGYMGTPGEMLTIAAPFIEQGWSVIGFLIPGHGSTAKVANSYRHEYWQKIMALKLTLVCSCFEEVHTAGFSTGGLLLHDFLLHNQTPLALKSQHLVSPFFVQRLKTFFDRLIEILFNGLSINIAYFFTRFRDLKVMTIDRQFYNQTLPITTARQIKKLGLLVYNEHREGKTITIPLHLFLTEGDLTVKTTASQEVIERDAVNVTHVWYAGSEPHHLMAPSVSKVALDLQQRIFKVIFNK